MTENKEPELIFDYTQFMGDSSPWQDLIDTDDYLVAINHLLKETLVIGEMFKPMLLAYLSLPSALCSRLPILALYGEKGTGKSTIGKLANIIHFGRQWQSKTLSPSDTFASIRNELSMRKYIGAIERNTIMVWDDISTETLLNNLSLYQLLKVGYDRATDSISMAGKSGENITFRVFCPKIASSVSAWFIDPRLDEIQRRVIPIETMSIGVDIELVSVEEFDWGGFNNLYSNYWQNETRIKSFLATKKSLIRKGSKFKKMFNHSPSRWAISHDLIACMSIIQGDLINPIETLNNYWQWFDSKYKNGVSSFLQLLAEYCGDKRAKADEYRKALGDLIDTDIIANHPKAKTIISPKELKAVISEWDRDGFLDIKPTHESILNLMSSLGYKLTKKGWEYTK